MLMMDEPTAALDPSRRGALGETLQALARDGRGLLLATHDVDFARVYADHVVVLADGQIVESGPAKQILAKP
jgi:ABC-type polar amino acid transport system ATPase subunit